MSTANKHFHLTVQPEPVPDCVIFGGTPAMQIVREKVERLATTNVPILIRGECGTGKEVLAAAIHSHSCGSEGAFVKIGCPFILADSLEKELLERSFMHADGSASEGIGPLQKGTVFFDEMSELHPALQAKLLQYFQDAQYIRIADRQGRRAELRVICTTNRDLEAEIKAQRFRQDLLYRINVFTIDLPPLRQRAEDIPALADFLLRTYCTRHNVPLRIFSVQLMELMQRYHWPGNIRELENLVRRYVILGSEQVIGSELLAKVSTDFHPEDSWGENISLKKLTRQAAFELERRVILKTLENNGWNRKRAARSLNISYRALLYKIKQGGMPPKRSVPSKAPMQISSDD